MKSRLNISFSILYILLGILSIVTIVFTRKIDPIVNIYWKIYEPLIALVTISSIVALSISKEKVKDNVLWMAISFICSIVTFHAIWRLSSAEFGYLVATCIDAVLLVIGIGYYFIRLVLRD